MAYYVPLVETCFFVFSWDLRFFSEETNVWLVLAAKEMQMLALQKCDFQVQGQFSPLSFSFLLSPRFEN